MSLIPSQTPHDKKGLKQPSDAGSSFKNISRENAPVENKWVSVVKDKVHALRFGVVQITVHNGSVVQVESTERTRVDIEH